jgi:hypothetical protein
MTDGPEGRFEGEPEETPEHAIENYNAWAELVFQKAEQGDWDGNHEMVEETPYKGSYLYCLIRAYRDLPRSTSTATCSLGRRTRRRVCSTASWRDSSATAPAPAPAKELLHGHQAAYRVDDGLDAPKEGGTCIRPPRGTEASVCGS